MELQVWFNPKKTKQLEYNFRFFKKNLNNYGNSYSKWSFLMNLLTAKSIKKKKLISRDYNLGV
jgi:hypothetical protein